MNDEITKITPENKPSNPWKNGFWAILISAVFLLTIGTSIAVGWWLNEQKGQNAVSLAENKTDGNAVITETEASIASVAEKVAPSVVSIVTSTQVRSYFGNSSSQGAGTGIIVSEDGYIMTNNHVIDGASAVSVVDNNGNTYENVKVIGRDPLNDIAFLKVSSQKKFTPASIGDSSTLRIGQQLVAIGNALGRYKNTVTSGILSGTGRPIVASDGRGSSEALTDLLQTDASINSGNSGGPLLNMAGQVIGINTAVASDANGIGFAIPINATKGVLNEVLASGEVQRAYIGVNFIEITPEVAREYDLSVNRGAFIFNEKNSAVISGSPADKAGVKDEDIIQKVNDKTVGEHGGFSSLIGQYRVGDKVTLTILRDGKTIKLEATLGKYSS